MKIKFQLTREKMLFTNNYFVQFINCDKNIIKQMEKSNFLANSVIEKIRYAVK